MSTSDSVDSPWGEFDGGSVMVAIPSYHTWESKTVTSAINCLMLTNELMHRHGLPITRFSVQQSEGTYLHRGRELLAETAVEREFDWIFWIDTDMRFPPDTLVRLLSTGKDIVGANYSRRSVNELGYTAIKTIYTTADQTSQSCVTGPDSDGLEEVEAIGFGCCLTKTEVFTEMPKPWFWYEYLGNGDMNQQIGEDVWFCIRAREAGYKIHVDHGLSHQVKHLGSFEFGCENAWQAVPEEDKEPVTDRRLELVEA